MASARGSESVKPQPPIACPMCGGELVTVVVKASYQCKKCHYIVLPRKNWYGDTKA